MMKMTMRLQKSQVTSATYQKHTTSAVFTRGPFLAAGYTKVDAMAVGACGGRSGNATSDDDVAMGSGGGGGGFVRQTLDLAAISRTESISIGAMGSTGANVGAGEGFAGDGGAGGSSTFASLVGPGGLGAWGGRISFTGVLLAYSSGGYGSEPDHATGGLAGGDSPVVGTKTESSGVITGSGGGGGGGRIKEAAGLTSSRQAGANGSQGGTNNYRQTSPDLSNNTVNGRSGGGVNVAPFTGGSAEYFGSLGVNSAANGVVLLRVS